MKLFLLFLFLPCVACAQTGVKGTITYPVRPDAGSHIYLIKYDGDAVARYEEINAFLTVKKLRVMNNDVARLTTLFRDSADVYKGRKKFEAEYNAFQEKIARVKADADDRTQKMKAFDGDTKAGFDLLDQKAAKALSPLKFTPGTLSATADASGRYAISSATGKFIILIISNNRTGFTSAESSGKIFSEVVDLKEGESVTVDARFTID